MVRRRSVGEKVFDSFNVFLMLVLIIVTLYPVLHVAFASISQPSRLIQHSGILMKPLGLNFGAYGLVFRNPMILKGYQNTMIYVIAGTSLNLFMTILAAYVLSRPGLLLKKYMMIMIVISMYFSGGLIPSFLLIKKLGLFNTRLAIILPSAVSAWNIIIMRTSFLALPRSLEESARIDGAKDFTILFRIIVPLSKPVIAVMLLFYSVGHWNSWFSAMVYLRDRQLYPLQLILREILISSDLSSMLTEVADLDKEPIGETVKYATIMIASIPILCVYPFLQKYFVKGVMVGALKG